MFKKNLNFPKDTFKITYKEAKMKGTVKFFNEEKGFGFIKGDDDKEYFVHQSGLKDEVNLQEDDSVIFDVEDGDRGPKAVNVTK